MEPNWTRKLEQILTRILALSHLPHILFLLSCVAQGKKSKSIKENPSESALESGIIYTLYSYSNWRHHWLLNRKSRNMWGTFFVIELCIYYFLFWSWCVCVHKKLGCKPDSPSVIKATLSKSDLMVFELKTQQYTLSEHISNIFLLLFLSFWSPSCLKI